MTKETLWILQDLNILLTDVKCWFVLKSHKLGIIKFETGYNLIHKFSEKELKNAEWIQNKKTV